MGMKKPVPMKKLSPQSAEKIRQKVARVYKGAAGAAY
jgi:hypothetical protein